MSNSCDPIDCSTPGLPVHHQLPEFTQTHVHWVGDAIQPSHPLSSPSLPAFKLSQHQGLNFQMSQFFTSGGQRTGVSASASVLPVNIQHWFPLGWTGDSLLEIKPRLDFWVMWPLAHFFTSVCLGLIFKVWIRVSTFHLESCAVCLLAQSCPTLWPHRL